MDNNIILSLGENYSGSKLTTQVYEDELKEINSKYPLGENQIDIQATYFLNNTSDLEVGFFIRNGSNKKLSFEKIILTVRNEQDNDVVTKEFNFKSNGIIPPHAARPFVENFPIDEDIELEDLDKFTIKFKGLNNLDIFSSVPTEIENIPMDIAFEEEQAIREFSFKLKTLKAGDFDIFLYKLSRKDNGALQCILLFRNGASREAKIEKLPIAIVNEAEKVVARKVFTDPEGVIKVDPMQSKIMTFNFKSSIVKDKNADLSTCRVVFK